MVKKEKFMLRDELYIAFDILVKEQWFLIPFKPVVLLLQFYNEIIVPSE